MTAPAERSTAGVTIQRAVDWCHLDPAGHWYHARVWYLVDATEAHLRQALGFGSIQDCACTPRRAIEATFHGSPTMGDILDVTVEFAHVGHASAAYRFFVECAGRLVADGKVTIVYVDPATGRPAAWPAPWRDAMLTAGRQPGHHLAAEGL